MELERNAGLADRYWRITAGALLWGVGVARLARGGGEWVGLLSTATGSMLIADGILGTCPLYGPLEIDTRENAWMDETGAKTEEMLYGAGN